MVHIKTKEGASLWIALLATAIVAVGMVIQHIEWWITLCTSVGVFVVVALAALFIIRKYVAYKLKPIYSIVLSRDVHTHEIFSELKDKHVENIGEELTAWADTNDKEIDRLIALLKGFVLPISDYAPFEYAVVTAGGVRCDEVNRYTMESLKVKGLYFAGEVLDLDANTGGYNLQIAFSTGRLAGMLKQ